MHFAAEGKLELNFNIADTVSSALDKAVNALGAATGLPGGLIAAAYGAVKGAIVDGFGPDGSFAKGAGSALKEAVSGVLMAYTGKLEIGKLLGLGGSKGLSTAMKGVVDGLFRDVVGDAIKGVGNLALAYFQKLGKLEVDLAAGKISASEYQERLVAEKQSFEEDTNKFWAGAIATLGSSVASAVTHALAGKLPEKMVTDLTNQLVDALRSAMSDSGAEALEKVLKKAKEAADGATAGPG